MTSVIVKTSVTLVAAALPLAGAWAQDAKKQLVGVWQLVSDVNTKDGKKSTSFGPNPKGQFIFTANGRYMSINTNPDIPKFASGNRREGTAEENKAVVQGSIAHYGTWDVSPDGKTLILGTWPSWIGTEQKRQLSLKGGEMKYTVNASIGGTSELVYKKLK